MSWEPMSALAPAGAQAARLAHVYWVFFWVCTVVYVVVIAVLAIALARRSAAFDEPRRLRPVLAGGAVTALILIGLLVVSARAGHGLNPLPNARGVVTVQVTARQWWWELRYPGGAPDEMVVTANELHIPVGTPVLLKLVSRDVIHSFWVPALHGKRDLIPGHDSTTYIQADRPGVFRGQCAEFCGLQHAKMAFLVIAEPPAAFQAWLARQRQAAPPPATAQAVHGRDLFAAGTCPMCHAISGTPFGATLGPDLTHVASRLTLGAASVANARGHLARWVFDAQSVKPGTRMPPVPMADRELADVVAYLETLR